MPLKQQTIETVDESRFKKANGRQVKALTSRIPDMQVLIPPKESATTIKAIVLYIEGNLPHLNGGGRCTEPS